MEYKLSSVATHDENPETVLQLLLHSAASFSRSKFINSTNDCGQATASCKHLLTVDLMKGQVSLEPEIHRFMSSLMPG